MPVPLVLAGAALNTAGTILSDIPVIGGLLNQHPQDPERLADNKTLYDAALAGDATAISSLGVRGGVLPPGTAGTTGSALATQVGRDDAAAKYNALLRMGANTTLRGAAVTPGGPAATPTLSILGNASAATGVPTLWLLLAAVVVLVLVVRRGA